MAQLGDGEEDELLAVLIATSPRCSNTTFHRWAVRNLKFAAQTETSNCCSSSSKTAAVSTQNTLQTLNDSDKWWWRPASMLSRSKSLHIRGWKQADCLTVTFLLLLDVKGESAGPASTIHTEPRGDTPPLSGLTYTVTKRTEVRLYGKAREPELQTHLIKMTQNQNGVFATN